MNQFAAIVRCAALVAAMLTAIGRQAVAAETVADLYRAQVHVTGQEEPARSNGFAAGLADVLAKLSGDPSLIGDPAVAKLGEAAASLVTTFSYRDLMAGIPLHDEQGTRQRPYILTIDFDRERIDAALKSLGRTPWPAERPRLILFIAVDNGTAPYLLAIDGPHGRDQRDALADVSWRYGVPFGLPKLLWRLKVRGPRSARLALLGIRKKYRNVRKYATLSAFMYAEMNDGAKKLGIEEGELGWTLEDNGAVNAGIKMMGGKAYKRYRVYEKSLA